MIVIDKRSGLPHSTHPRSSMRDRATSYASPIIRTSFFRGVSRSFWPFLIIMWMRGSFSFHMYSAFCAVGRVFVDFYLVSTPMSLRDIHKAKSLLETTKNSKESILEWWYYGRFWHSYINRHSQLFLISFFLFCSSVACCCTNPLWVCVSPAESINVLNTPAAQREKKIANWKPVISSSLSETDGRLREVWRETRKRVGSNRHAHAHAEHAAEPAHTALACCSNPPFFLTNPLPPSRSPLYTSQEGTLKSSGQSNTAKEENLSSAFPNFFRAHTRKFL